MRRIDCNGRDRAARGEIHHQPGEGAHNLGGRYGTTLLGVGVRFTVVVVIFLRAGETHTLVKRYYSHLLSGIALVVDQRNRRQLLIYVAVFVELNSLSPKPVYIGKPVKSAFQTFMVHTGEGALSMEVRRGAGSAEEETDQK